ncbi:hypothetical protein HPB52_008226 [Rhipicephalus sanguineus]|uniref:YqaJ viral recombinase domain-containing protein n=1 Tax=Rhipicephalus sanguineus TaxID=34632 RepID=A0A9D4QCU7_RHISA|nr:hypothetical protein HPB52_008226 [Rhipicephalus sanguineus]
MSVMESPTMSKGAFLRREGSIGKMWKGTLIKEMTEAGEEEKMLAEASGDFCEDGTTPWITVVVDGGWSHRSHGRRYSANSGVAVIVGKRTKKLLYLGTRVDHGRFIKKNECANHVVKCYTSRLYSIAKESKGTRSLLSGPRIKRIKNGARKAVSHYAKILRDFEGSEQDLNKETARLIQELASDIRNGPLHVFGSHDGCKSYFCNGSKGDNLHDGLPKIQVKLMSAANIIADKADRLITDDTSNLAEAIMSLVAKFAGGKQINRCQRGSYEQRCQGGGLHFQLGPERHAKASEGVTCASGAPILKKYAQKRLNMKRQAISRKRRLLQESGCRERTYSNQALSDSAPHYGPKCQKPDMSALQTQKSSCSIYKWMKTGKQGSKKKRVARLAIMNGTNKEGFASPQEGTVVQPCGLFVDLEHGFLAASTDGLVGTDRIVEVKCPFRYKEDEPMEAARKFLTKKQKDGDPVLSRSHRYFYDVQGQLHITRRIMCDFVVYTTKGIHVQEIHRDDAFWKTKMEPFLLRFYKDCVLPEIVDSRLARSMGVRRPEWNRLAIEAKEKTKNDAASKAKKPRKEKE